MFSSGAPIAQSVEQRTLNPLVDGLSLSGPTLCERIKLNLGIGFLVINQIPGLASRSIERVLQLSQEKIYIGFVNSRHLVGVPTSTQIELIDLSLHANTLGINRSSDGEYLSFDDSNFFNLVRLKWYLLREILLRHEAVVYTDLDVVWFRDITKEIAELFARDAYVDAVIQDASTDIRSVSLCMGVFALKRGAFAEFLITNCLELHSNGLTKYESYGDDNAIIDFYLNSTERHRIQRLPQSAYPVGIFSNLLLPFALKKGWSAKAPSIFHANYLIGLEAKVDAIELADRLVRIRSYHPFVRVFALLWTLTASMIHR